MPQINPFRAGQSLAVALEDATEADIRGAAAEERRAIYRLCATCSDLEAGELVRTTARMLFALGVREDLESELLERARLATIGAPLLGGTEPPAAPAAPPANDGASAPSSTLPPPPPDGVA